MSPLLCETVHLALLPGEALGVKYRKGLRARPLVYSKLAGAGLAEVLTDLRVAHHARVSLTVSDRFVKLLLLRPSEGLRAESDWHGFAAHRFSEVFGSEMHAWHIRIASGGAGMSRLACALDPSVLQSLSPMIDSGAIRLISLQPHFVRRFNALRRTVGKTTAWMVNHEPGGVLIALIVDGEWRLVRQRRVESDWPHGLPALLQREVDLTGISAPAKNVFVADLAEDVEPVHELGGFKISRMAAPRLSAPHPAFRMVLH